MPLGLLEVRRVRNIDFTRMEPGPSINVLAGDNGSGKTSLLEAIHILGVGKSFRTTQTKDIMRRNSQDFSVTGRYINTGGLATTVGIKRIQKGFEIKINGVTEKKVATLAKVFPLQCITADSHFGFLHSAKQRRATLDWGLFHVEPDFYEIWLRYRRLIKQRNAALKERASQRLLEALDKSLIPTAKSLNNFRLFYLDHLNSVLCDYGWIYSDSGATTLTLELLKGWGDGVSFEQALQKDRERDYQRGITHSGPHRADIVFRINNERMADFASNGQQKLGVIALCLAQMELLANTSGHRPLLLLDDISAELDQFHGAKLMKKLASLQLQVFATATDVSQVPLKHWPEARVFHVEQGTFLQEKIKAYA
ncbi:MAG: DNA replication/repair protein RecF [Gammaproteobacteria bacterium]|nr:DNA replication/repair protein RecF [Gammaproteobacteria bacterium]